MSKIMVDLETMSDQPDALIMSIGACTFDHPGAERKTFYVRIDAESHQRLGGHVSMSTVLWWMKQSENARAEMLASPRVQITVALLGLAGFVREVGAVEVWGNGADFDCVVLQSAFRNACLPEPWSFRSHRCFRTMKSLFPQFQEYRLDDGTPALKHHALHDAVAQARRLEAILAHVRSAEKALRGE